MFTLSQIGSISLQCYIDNGLLKVSKSCNGSPCIIIGLDRSQIQRLKEMFYKGDFRSSGWPINHFALHDGIVSMWFEGSHDLIQLSLAEMGRLFQYYERHNQRIK